MRSAAELESGPAPRIDLQAVSMKQAPRDVPGSVGASPSDTCEADVGETHFSAPGLLLPWKQTADASSARQSCALGWAVADRPARRRLRRHVLLSAALHGQAVPRPLRMAADPSGLHYEEEIDAGVWPPTLAEQPPGPDAAATVCRLALAIGRVLQALERGGVAHGRIEPRCVRWQAVSDQVWLTDFDLGGFVHAPDDWQAHGAADHAADLVALGRLLAWRLSADPAWLHPAAAAAGEPLRAAAPDPFLHQVVDSLLKAGGPDGYRSARALCEELVGGVPRPRPAALGRPLSWRLPSERVGRTLECDQMLRAFDDVATCPVAGEAAPRHAPVLLVVDGRSGIGKTSVVLAACREMRARSALIACGKFNQYGSQSPLAALLDALDDALFELAELEADARAKVADTLRAELGAMAGVLTPSLVWLDRLIGPQPAAPELGPEASRTRFELALRRLVAALCGGSTPLVLFVDDLQWADVRTLELLGGLLTEPRMGRLLLLGAFRTEAVDAGHALQVWLARLAGGAAPDLRRVQVQGWRSEDIARLLETGGIPSGKALAQAAQALHRHGGGNPFTTLQLLRAAEQEGAIRPNATGPGWQIDTLRLDALLDGRSVLSLVQARLCRLPEVAQAALSDAAHLGAQCSVETLAVARGSTVLQVCRDLAPALATGLVLPLDEDGAGHRLLTMRFLHDVVQQAAYELVAPEQRDALRLRLGSSLLRHARDQGHLDQFLFAILQQFNGVKQTAAGALDAATFVLLNERAGQLASAQGASEDALQYFLRAVDASSLGDAKAPGDAAFGLYRHAAEAACVATRFDVADRLLDRADALGPDALEAARIDELRLRLLLARNRLGEALALGQRRLTALGVPLMPLGDPAAWPGVPAPGSLDLSRRASPEADIAQRLLVGLTPCAFITSFELYARVIRTMIELAVQWPASAWTPLAWTNYGLTLCGLERRDEAFAASELALSMLGRIEDAALRCKVRVLCLGFLRHWRLPLGEQLDPLLAAYEDCQVSGDQEYLGYAAFLYCDKAWALLPLDELVAQHMLHTSTVRQFGHAFSHHHCRVWLQGLLALRGDTASEPLRLSGPAFSEDDDLPLLEAAQNSFSLFTAHTLRAALAWHRGEREACWLACGQALRVAANGTGTLMSVDLQVLAALSAPVEESMAFRDRLAAWAEVAPQNLAHKLDLVDGVLAVRAGRLGEALPLLERASEAARHAGFVRDQLLAEQAASETAAQAGDREACQRWFAQAWRSGLRWGALAVVERLLARHAERMAALDRRADASLLGARSAASAFDLARVSHDLRNPLSGVMGLTSVLLASKLDERQRRLAMLTKASATSLLAMVNDIMDLGQLAHGPLRLRREPVELRPLAEQLIASTRVLHGDIAVDLRLVVDPAVPRHLVSDGQRLRQVIGKLLSNAMNFTRKGHVELRIECLDEAGGTLLRIVVDDTGAGIAEAEQDQVFSAFYQPSIATDHPGGSSGMGLTVAKAIVEALGGTIGFRSRAGEGSCFWFTLPIELPPIPRH